MDDVVVFDGLCNLCTRSVLFILEHEADHVLRFAPLQSKFGARVMREFGLDPPDVKTFVLIADGKPYVRSEAAIRIAEHLRGAWKLLALLRLVPRPLRDWAYDVLARNRYRWFGRRESCMVPAAPVRARFIDD